MRDSARDVNHDLLDEAQPVSVGRVEVGFHEPNESARRYNIARSCAGNYRRLLAHKKRTAMRNRYDDVGARVD